MVVVVVVVWRGKHGKVMFLSVFHKLCHYRTLRVTSVSCKWGVAAMLCVLSCVMSNNFAFCESFKARASLSDGRRKDRIV